MATLFQIFGSSNLRGVPQTKPSQRFPPNLHDMFITKVFRTDNNEIRIFDRGKSYFRLTDAMNVCFHVYSHVKSLGWDWCFYLGASIVIYCTDLSSSTKLTLNGNI